MTRGLVEEPAPSATRPFDSSPKPSSDRPTGLWRDTLRLLSKSLAEAAYQKHRLRFVHTEDDGSFTYVCVCGDGFADRRKWNAHITDSFSEVIE